MEFMVNANLSKEINNCLKKKPDISLNEFVKLLNEKEEEEKEETEDRERKNIKWWKENLIGKNVMFKQNNGYRIFKPIINEYDFIEIVPLYDFSFPESFNCGDFKGKKFDFRVMTKETFRVEWVRSPYNNWQYNQKYAYIISDEKLEEIKTKFDNFIKFYNELCDFENSDYATKVE